MVLGVRVPASSLFHEEKFAFFGFEVRGTPKIFKIFLGVPPKILKQVGVLPAAAKRLRPCCTAASAVLHSGCGRGARHLKVKNANLIGGTAPNDANPCKILERWGDIF